MLADEESLQELYEKISKSIHNLPLSVIQTNKEGKNSSKPWSKWNYEEYIAFQNCIRKAISESGYNSPIEWENAAWIEVAEYRK